LNQFESIITQLEHQRAAIESAIAALRQVGGQGAVTSKRLGRPPGTKNAAKKRTISGEGRQRQIEAMRKYWAAKKAGKKYPSKKRSA
jgi:hypothetical protein